MEDLAQAPIAVPQSLRMPATESFGASARRALSQEPHAAAVHALPWLWHALPRRWETNQSVR